MRTTVSLEISIISMLSTTGRGRHRRRRWKNGRKIKTIGVDRQIFADGQKSVVIEQHEGEQTINTHNNVIVPVCHTNTKGPVGFG